MQDQHSIRLKVSIFIKHSIFITSIKPNIKGFTRYKMQYSTNIRMLDSIRYKILDLLSIRYRTQDLHSIRHKLLDSGNQVVAKKMVVVHIIHLHNNRMQDLPSIKHKELDLHSTKHRDNIFIKHSISTTSIRHKVLTFIKVRMHSFTNTKMLGSTKYRMQDLHFIKLKVLDLLVMNKQYLDLIRMRLRYLDLLLIRYKMQGLHHMNKLYQDLIHMRLLFLDLLHTR